MSGEKLTHVHRDGNVMRIQLSRDARWKAQAGHSANHERWLNKRTARIGAALMAVGLGFAALGTWMNHDALSEIRAEQEDNK